MPNVRKTFSLKNFVSLWSYVFRFFAGEPVEGEEGGESAAMRRKTSMIASMAPVIGSVLFLSAMASTRLKRLHDMDIPGSTK